MSGNTAITKRLPGFLIINNDGEPLALNGTNDDRIWFFYTADAAILFMQERVEAGSYKKVSDMVYMDIKQEPNKLRKIIQADILFEV